MFRISTVKIARAGVIGALYVGLSLLTMPISSGLIQLRLSEALTILPLLFPETAIGLFAGCMLSNLICGCAVYDIVLGAIITLIAGVMTAVIGKAIKNKPLKVAIGGLFPVVLNAFLLPLVWWLCYGQLEVLYILQVAYLTCSQTIAVYGVGIPLYIGADKFATKKLL